MTDNKWKTQPCKDCILKGKCSSSCFKYPSYQTICEFSREGRHLMKVKECIACGEEVSGAMIWCETCYQSQWANGNSKLRWVSNIPL